MGLIVSYFSGSCYDSFSWIQLRGGVALARVHCGWGTDNIYSSLIWTLRSTGVFSLYYPWEHTVGRRGWYIEKVGSGYSSRLFLSTFFLGRGPGEVECLGLLVHEKKGTLTVSVSQIFNFTLRGWVVNSGWEKLVSG